jgi:DNA-binding NarL/FixJ family response regulator
MVIMNSIDEKNINRPGIADNMNQYVYLFDNEQEMMLILKRDLGENSTNCSTAESAPVQEFITGKVQNLLDRIKSDGPLSLREMEVLNYAAMGKSNKEIAEIIGLSQSTIKNHFSSTLRKLHANDRTHAVTLALCNGWINAKTISNRMVNEKAPISATNGYQAIH